MNEQNTTPESTNDNQPASVSQTTPEVQTPVTPLPPIEKSSSIKSVEKATVWIMVLSAIAFAVISIMAIWGLFGNNRGDVIWRSFVSVAVIAFAALVVNVGANILDHSKKK